MVAVEAEGAGVSSGVSETSDLSHYCHSGENRDVVPQ